ncbi:MAG TPA: uracil-DNA glycosylase [Thermoplasmata archaeon]
MGEAPRSLTELSARVVACRACPRLVAFRERVAVEKKRSFQSEAYWGRPVPGFGDPNARLVVIGLAPAAHGSNRTGRVFTGDRSAGFLVRGLYDAGFASQPTSEHRGDGLRYQGLYLTAAVRCVPPENRPSPEELGRCRPFLEGELALLREARAYLALGGFAWDATLDAAAKVHGVARPKVPFAHGACAPLGPGRPLVFGSYHPSPQNTNTGRLTPEMFRRLMTTVKATWAE